MASSILGLPGTKSCRKVSNMDGYGTTFKSYSLDMAYPSCSQYDALPTISDLPKHDVHAAAGRLLALRGTRVVAVQELGDEGPLLLQPLLKYQCRLRLESAQGG